jgi:predicted PurR-regulated permease PerM
MLYLLFFLFRDGDRLAGRIQDAISLALGLRDELLENYH